MSWLDKKPILALAPMADMTDSPFCRVCREVESRKEKVESNKFIVFREMVSAEAIVRGNEKTFKMCEFDEIEKPIVLQLFGSNAKVIVDAARILTERFLAPDRTRNELSGIDINMGCPVPKIAGKGLAGASLMKDHERAVEIVKALKKANLGLPISVKTRLGWSKNDEILEFAPKLEQAGADALTIHGRTKMQGYSGVADWEMIARAKALVKIPVIANGDIHSLEDYKRCMAITNADGVMVGRSALGNPWVFQQLQISNFQFPKIGEIVTTVLRHAELHLERYGENSMTTFRKHLLCYFKGVSGTKDLKQELVKVKTLAELKSILQKIPE